MREPHFKWVDTTESGHYDWDKMMPVFEEMSEGEEFEFHVERQRDDNLSFSAEAVESVARATMSFFLVRAKNHWEVTQTAPRRAKVTIKIEME